MGARDFVYPLPVGQAEAKEFWHHRLPITWGTSH